MAKANRCLNPGRFTLLAVAFLAVTIVLGINATEASAANLGVGISIPPLRINQTAPIQNSTPSVNGTNVSIGLPVAYNGTGQRNITMSLPSSWRKVANIRINESGVIKNVTVAGSELTWEANMSVTNVTLLFDAAPPSLNSVAKFVNNTFNQVNLTIESDNSFTNASASIEVNSSYSFYTLYWFNGTGYVDKTTEFNLRVANGIATFDSFSTSTVLFRLEGSTTCAESWICTGWSDPRQCGTRTCSDSSHCGTTASKPSESSSCDAAQSAAGGGGGGGGAGKGVITTPVKEAAEEKAGATQPLSIDKASIKISVKPGEFKKVAFTITNKGLEKLRLSIETEGISEFVSLDTSYVELAPGSSRALSALVLVEKEEKPGIYTGKIRISGDGAEAAANVIIEVLPFKTLFDVSVAVNPRTKTIIQGEGVIGEVSLVNLAGYGRIDADVLYGLKDASDNVLVSRQKTVAVETSGSFSVFLDVPKKSAPGIYSLFALVSVNSTVVGVGSDTFEVIPSFQYNLMALTGTNLVFWVVITLFVLTLVLALFSIREVLIHHLPYRTARKEAETEKGTGIWAALKKIKPARKPKAAAGMPVTRFELERKLRALEQGFSEGLVSVKAYIEDKVKIERELKRFRKQ